MRASHTHGGGAKKKRRGSGHRGGFGMAGSGKRADQRKPTILKLYGPEYFGKHGFIRPKKIVFKVKAINISEIERNLDSFINKNLITKEKDLHLIDLKRLGYDKVIGSGTINKKYKITGKVSKKAREKIEKLGGIVEES
jgi:large subunit ribosomal protein L15